MPPNSGCPSSRLSVGGHQVTLILSSFVYRSENHTWSSFNILASLQSQCWRPVCHKGSFSVPHLVSGFLRFSFSFLIRIILPTMSCVFLWSAATLAAVVITSTLLIFACWSWLLVSFLFASLLPPVLLSFGLDSFRLRPASLASSRTSWPPP